MSSELCTTGHQPPRSAAPGLLVCNGCAHHAADAIRLMPHLHTLLASYLDTASHGKNPGSGAVSTSHHPGLKLDTAVAEARADIESCLTTWVSYALSPRPDGRPAFSTPPATTRPHDTAGWILDRIDWYLTDDQAADFTHDTTRTYARAKRQRQRDHTATFSIGPCPEPDCSGTLITRMRPADSLLPSVIWCDAAPTDPETGEQTHTWPAGAWLKLGAKVHDANAQDA